MTTARASIVFRVLLRLTVWPALALPAAAACQATTSPDDGGPPAPVFCKTDMECPSGTNCSYEIDLGCGVADGGECRVFPADADITQCAGQAGPACTCDGQTIQIPPCWDFLAPMPVVSMGACGAADAGPGGG